MTLSRMTSPARMRGLSIVELMIALTLGLVISAGVVNVFIASKQGYQQDAQVANLQENARFALKILRRELSMAGYMAATVPLGLQAAAAPAIGGDCQPQPWALNVMSSMEFDNNVAAGFSNKCVSNAQALTDVVSVRRTADDFTIREGLAQTLPNGSTDAGAPVAAAPSGKRMYFINNSGANTSGDLTYFLYGQDVVNDPDVKSGAFNAAEYYAKSFFVRTYSSTVGDGIPCLAVNSLNTSAKMQQDCLVEGVEDMQLEFGIDTTGDRVPEFYTDTPTAKQIQDQVAAITIHTLVRSTNTVRNYVDTKTYTVGKKAVAAKNDNYYRRVFSTTFRVPNIIHLSGT